MEEYITFTIISKEGKEIEMAVTDEFDYENKHYVVACRVENDTIITEGQYIYKAKITDDGFVAEKINNAIDYQRVVNAYMEME